MKHLRESAMPTIQPSFAPTAPLRAGTEQEKRENEPTYRRSARRLVRAVAVCAASRYVSRRT